MALSQADFYAYSRATGAPVPRDPEEQAQMVPAVLEFRRNQLKATEPQQQQGFGLPQALGIGAAVAGLGAAGYGISRLLRQKPAAAVSASAVRPATVDLEPAVRRVAAEGVPQTQPTPVRSSPLSEVRPSVPASVKTVDLDDEFSTLPGVIGATRSSLNQGFSPRQSSRIPDPWGATTAPPRQAAQGFSPRQYAESTGSLEAKPIVSDLTSIQSTQRPAAQDQFINAVESGEDQATGRIKTQLQRNEDYDLSQIEVLEDIAEYSRIQGMEQSEPITRVASVLPDGLPLDQAKGEQKINELVEEGKRYLRAQEIDTDYDYAVENAIQTRQVNQRIRRPLDLRKQARQILDDFRLQGQQVNPQEFAANFNNPQEFAANFNKQYREELNDELRLVDNARQRAELRGEETREIGEDIESLLSGGMPSVETTMRGKQLRGGKPGITGDISYLDEAGRFASADTGLKTRQEQGIQFQEKARTLNRLRGASDEELTFILQKNQQDLENNQPRTRLEADTARLASEVLRSRAINNPEPTPLQLDALERAQASVDLSRQILNQARNQRPTLAPGPAQDVARSMETLRRGMIVDPSEPLPEYPSVQQLRTGYVSDELGDIGPILGASDVYTGAAAEAAGPVIFTGKSKANTVIRDPRITGKVETATGRKYLTQYNPDVLGTVYNVAGTPANRAIAAQVEQNAQNFLADALAGGLQQKAISTPETYVTPGREPGPLLPPQYGPRISPLSLAGSLGLPGQEPSKRTHYAQYRPGRSATTPISPFIGDMPGGVVIATLQTPSRPVAPGRDIGAAPGRMDLTRRGEKARYYSQVPQAQFITGMEPAPIGPLTQSPGLSRIGGYSENPIKGAGGTQIIQPTSIGQRTAYPRMTPLRQAPDYSGNIATNIPRYGIGGENWQNDLMRSAYRRGGPIRTYRAEP